eukprot:Platyproteum_vivax@DN2293_c0_g1_i2.p1
MAATNDCRATGCGPNTFNRKAGVITTAQICRYMIYHEKNIEVRAKNAMEFRETGHVRPVVEETREEHREGHSSSSSHGASSPTRKRPLPTPPPVADKYICYLCSRQFSTTQMLSRHELLSDLHKQNVAAQKGFQIADGAEGQLPN